MERKPAVAGQFYEASRSKLTEQVSGYIKPDLHRKEAIGIVSPHAGLMYSGPVAGEVYSQIKFPHTFIIIGPNHTGLGGMVSIMSSGSWKMPTGDLVIDEKFAVELKTLSNLMDEDSVAHSVEHSLEVQLPFILYFSQKVKIVPIVIMTDSIDVCKAVGNAIADEIQRSKYPVTIIASSDMSHYVNDSTAKSKDSKAINKMLDLDPEGLFSTVKKEGISMCGVIPVTTMLYASLKLGATNAELVKYMTSGEVSGDYDYVVGYAGLIINGSQTDPPQHR